MLSTRAVLTDGSFVPACCLIQQINGGEIRGSVISRMRALICACKRIREDTILRLGEKDKVPIIYDDIVVGIVDDFLGKSVIIEHLFSDFDNNRLCTIYG